MRTFKVLALVLFTSLAFNACSDNEEKDVNPLEKDYFTIENGKYVEGNLLGGTEDLIESLHVNKTVINGGSAALYITSATELQSMRVAIKDVEGYYDYSFPKTATLKSTKAGSYEYEVVILLSQALSSKNIVFSLVAVATDGLLGKIFDTDDIKVLAAGTGELQISLSWDQQDDVDLHLYDAEDNHVFYRNRRVLSPDGIHKDASAYVFLRLKLLEETDQPVESLDPHDKADQAKLENFASKAGIEVKSSDFVLEYNNYLAKNAAKFGIIGMLDIDSNADCRIDGINNENITYSNLKDGVYRVEVDLYSKCVTPWAKYIVTVNHKGRSVKLSEKHKGQFKAISSNRVTIGSFKISGGQLTVVNEPESGVMARIVEEDEKKVYSIF